MCTCVLFIFFYLRIYDYRCTFFNFSIVNGQLFADNIFLLCFIETASPKATHVDIRGGTTTYTEATHGKTSRRDYNIYRSPLPALWSWSLEVHFREKQADSSTSIDVAWNNLTSGGFEPSTYAAQAECSIIASLLHVNLMLYEKDITLRRIPISDFSLLSGIIHIFGMTHNAILLFILIFPAKSKYKLHNLWNEYGCKNCCKN